MDRADHRLDQHSENSRAERRLDWIVTNQEAEYRAVDRADRCLDQHGESPPRAAAATSVSLNFASPTAVSVEAPTEELLLLQPATQRHDGRHRLHGGDDGRHRLDWSVVVIASMVAMIGATAVEHPCVVVPALATEEPHASQP